MAKAIDFIVDHLKAFIALGIYIVVLIVESFFSPWSSLGHVNEFISEFLNYSYIHKLLFCFIFSGVKETIDLMSWMNLCVDKTVFVSNKMQTFFSTGLHFLFNYYIVVIFLNLVLTLKCKIINIIDDNDSENEEESILNIDRIVVNFVVDNILMYLTCIAVYCIYPIMLKKLDNIIYNESLLLLVIIIWISLVALLSSKYFYSFILYLLYYSLYGVGILFTVKITELIFSAVNNHSLIINIITIILILIFGVLLNVILDHTFDSIQENTSKEVELEFNWFILKLIFITIISFALAAFLLF